MITLDEVASQEHMENWFRQLSTTDNPLLLTGALAIIKPKFFACDLAKKEAAFTFSTEDWQKNPDGSLHSGFITMAFDTACGLLLHYYAKQKMICTINLTTAFFRPMPTDKGVVYRAKILSIGKTIATMRAEAYIEGDEGNLIATADTTFMILQQNLSQTI